MTQKEATEEQIRVSRDELALLATMGDSEGDLRPVQLEMIQNVLNGPKRTIENTMVPLVNIAALPKDAPIDALIKKVADTGFSRIAVFEERVDNMVGFVNMLDVLYASESSSTITPFIRKNISFEPESRQPLSLLKQLQKLENQLSFVVDEYGGVVGLVTMEDLIEEIVGEIFDENEKTLTDNVRSISRSVIECEGNTEIGELNQHFNFDIPRGDYETIAGYVLLLIQRIPKQGELMETDTLKIVILEADSRKIKRIKIQKKSKLL